MDVAGARSFAAARTPARSTSRAAGRPSRSSPARCSDASRAAPTDSGRAPAAKAAKTAGVLEKDLLEQIRPELEAIKPWPAVFDRKYVKRLDGPNVKKGKNKKDLAEQVRRSARKAAQYAWGKKPVTRVDVVWV